MADVKVAAVRRGWHERLRERGEVFYVSDKIVLPRWMLVLKEPKPTFRQRLKSLFRSS